MATRCKAGVTNAACWADDAARFTCLRLWRLWLQVSNLCCVIKAYGFVKLTRTSQINTLHSK